VGWGSKLIGIGQIAGGALSFLTPAGPILGPSLIGGGISTITNDIAREEGNKAIDQATATQQAATDKAAGIQSQIFQGQQAALSPYQQVGSGAVGNLAALTGLPPIQMPSLPANYAAQTPQPSPNVAVPREAAPRQGSVRRPEMQDPQTTATLQSQSSYGSGTLADLGPKVTLRAPTGQMIQLPAGDPQIQKALALGAQRVA
jgi:hypothetical protein